MTIEVYKNYELKKHTTFKIGGQAKLVYFPNEIDELISLLQQSPSAIVLGGCSNVLISSHGIDETIIITSKINSYNFDNNILSAQCGTKGPLLSKECEKHSLSGFEFMIGFPGTIGGMVNMNASAHNQAIENSFLSCNVFDRKTSQVLNLTKNDMNFAYRNSIAAQKDYVILNAVFELTPTNSEKITELMQRNLEFRKQRQPSLVLPNIGSIFKNPQNDSAGRLLDIAGAKTLQSGGAKVWENHANFIVNNENASSTDVLNLMSEMHDLVKTKYTIDLHPEIKFIGKKTGEENKLWEKLSGLNTTTKQK